MIKYLKEQEKNLQRSVNEIKKTFLKPVYYDVEGISILLGYFWVHPCAEIIWFRTMGMLSDVRMEIIAKEKKGAV